MAKEKIKIQITGDSLALPRPTEGIPKGSEYSAILSQKYGYSVISTSTPWNTTESYFNIENVDYVVIHLGLVDCYPRLFSNETKKLLHRLPLPIRKFILLIASKNRYNITKTFQKTSVDSDTFSKNIKQMIESLLEWHITPIIVTIMDVDEKQINRNYGVIENIEKYNLVLKYYAGLYKCLLVDVNEISKYETIIRHTDGQHLSKAGHQLIAFLIDEEIKADRDSTCLTK
jgi:hypothetical protein